MRGLRHNRNSNDPTNSDMSVPAIANRNGHRGLTSGNVTAIMCWKAWAASTIGATARSPSKSISIIADKQAKTTDSTSVKKRTVT